MSMSQATAPVQARRQTNLDFAHIYGRKGIEVFPCKFDKSPAVRGGFHSASCDANIIAAMWGGTSNPIGLRCGKANDVTVVDLDVDASHADPLRRNAGVASLQAVMPALFDGDGKPTVPAVRTPSGGWHLYFKYDPRFTNSTKVLSKVDIRTEGGYVLAPYSQMGGGKTYRPTPQLLKFLNEANQQTGLALPAMPETLASALLTAKTKTVRPEAATSSQAVANTYLAVTEEQSDGAIPSTAEIAEALTYICPEDYGEWMQVITALHNHPNGYELGRAWSSQSSKHTEHVYAAKWSEVDPATQSLKTIFTKARTGGADLGELARKHHTTPKPVKMELGAGEYGSEEDIVRRCKFAQAQFAGVAQTVVPINEAAAHTIAQQAEQKPDINSALHGVALPRLPFKAWEQIDPATIPRVEFVYGDFMAKGYTSVTAAAPKVGKSLLALTEAVDIATGQGFMSGRKREPQRVLYYCAEDDQATINSRVIACLQQHCIEQKDIEGRLFPVSGVEMSGFVFVHGNEGQINEPVFKRLEEFCTRENIDCVIFDPLQDLSHSPETNEVFRLLGARLREFATQLNVAIGLIHHTRKSDGKTAASIDDMRGGSALRGTARFNRLLVAMKEDEAVKFGLETNIPYFRVGAIESNLAEPMTADAQWFEKVSTPIGNGSCIGAVKRWKKPSLFAGITPQHAAKVQRAVSAAVIKAEEEGTEGPRDNVQADKWVGKIVADVLDRKIETSAQRSFITRILKHWYDADILRTEPRENAQRKKVGFVFSGGNNPLSTA